MGWRYRKSINLGGGFRINLSKSGIGYSWGTKGYRVTKTATGQSRTTYSIPGTGISYVATNTTPRNNNTNYQPTKSSLTIGETTYYKSENMEDMAQNDIILKKIKQVLLINRIANIILICGIFLPYILIIGALMKLYILLCGRIKLDYEFDSYSEEKYSSLTSAIIEMKSNIKMWRVNTSVRNADLKYSSGATSSISRSAIEIIKGVPWYIKSSVDVYYIKDGKKKIYLTPDRIIVIDKTNVTGCKYNNLDFNIYNSKYVEDGTVPKDAKIVSYTWQYINKDGGPDRRFSNNRQIPICDYGGMSITSSDGINFRLQCSNIYAIAKATEYLNRFVELVNSEKNSEDSYYNFENAPITLEEADNNSKNPISSEENEPSFKKSKTSKSMGSIIWLIIKLMYVIIFAIICITSQMYIALIMWALVGIIFIFTFIYHPKYRIVLNIVAFSLAFCAFIYYAPKEYDGKYISDNNIQVTLDRNKAEIISDDLTKYEGNISYRINGNIMELTIKTKSTDDQNIEKEYHFIFNRDSKTLYEGELTYIKGK